MQVVVFAEALEPAAWAACTLRAFRPTAVPNLECAERSVVEPRAESNHPRIFRPLSRVLGATSVSRVFSPVRVQSYSNASSYASSMKRSTRIPGKSKRRHPRHGKVIETAKTVIVEWSPELTAVIKRLRKLGPDMRGTLFCNLEGKPYTESGFRSNWARLMNTALKGRKRKNGIVTLAPVLAAPFTFHDLRAKSGSDADDLQEANDRLAHDDLRTTQVVYRRKPRRARPGRKVGA